MFDGLVAATVTPMQRGLIPDDRVRPPLPPLDDAAKTLVRTARQPADLL